jgi:SAM-dependent methyltransferase
MSFGAEEAELEDHLRGDEAETVAFLAQLAGSGPALELAIGAGRIALPLAATGIRVDGVDFSPAMIARLRDKPSGENIAITMGDFVDVGVSGSYHLIYIVYNAFFNVLSQDDQVRCFENVAAHLDDGGVFVIEAFTPGFLHRLMNDQHVETEAIEMGEVALSIMRHDAATQTLEQNHVRLTSAGARFAPVVQRYAWPAELDLMARIAGLELKGRWGGWKREPFLSSSERHVSVYGR